MSELIPFEVWSTGADGTAWFCVEHMRLAMRRNWRGLVTHPRFTWKSDLWAARHAAIFDHDVRPVEEADRCSRSIAFDLYEEGVR